MDLTYEPALRGPALGFVKFHLCGLWLKAAVFRDRRGRIVVSPYRSAGMRSGAWDFEDAGLRVELLRQLEPYLVGQVGQGQGQLPGIGAGLQAAGPESDRATAGSKRTALGGDTLGDPTEAILRLERGIFGG